ncbi:MAG TPA: DUF4405 domain-containing protein [Desulfohalobiaceae bacterium]|nr:DUF4405 domain-containing protein [Desulfohalobiaceae bacterium]
MKINVIKYLVRVLLFVNICSVAVIGFILGYIIPQGRFPSPEAKFFLGLHRHEWMEIHLFMAIVFLVLLFIHLWIHRSWITESTKRYFDRHWKKFLCLISGAWFFIILISWLVVKL